MPSLFFPNLNALRLVLERGLVPTGLTRAPTLAGFDPLGRLWLELPELPSRELIAAMGRFGVQALGKISVPTETVRCWAELLPLRQSTNTAQGKTAQGKVLFVGPERDAASFVARLRRATKNPLGIALRDESIARTAWIAIDNPPQSFLRDIADRDLSFETNYQQSRGIWVQAGWEHPLPNELVVPPNSLLLFSPPRTVLLAHGAVPQPENDQYRIPKFNVRSPVVAARDIKVPVHLHLAPRQMGPLEEALWLVDDLQANEFWNLCGNADEKVLRKLEVATQASGSKTRVIIRSPANHRAPAILPLLATGYAQEPRLEGLFIPSNRTLRPQLRLRELSTVFGLNSDRLVWLEANSDGGLIANAIRLSAFRPLSEVIVYSAYPIEPLNVESRADPFSLTRFVLANESNQGVEQEEPISIADAEIDPERVETVPSETGWFLRSLKRLMARLNLDRENEIETESTNDRTPTAEKLPDRRVEQTLSSPDVLRHGPDWPQRRRTLETGLYQDLPRLGAEGRSTRWAALATAYGKLGNPGDAAVCWMNAAWEMPTPPIPWLKQWLAAECQAAKLTEAQCVLERWLSERQPGIGRVVAAYITVAGYTQPPAEFIATLPRILVFLDQHFDDIPVRAAWLARLATAKVCEGDALGLARWHDRVLGRLGERGPGLDLDEPSFLRFHGSVSGERFQAARKWLESIRDKVHEWINRHGKSGNRQQADRLFLWAGLIAEKEATTAYADFMLAWGLGCLGERIQANSWAARARKKLLSTSSPGADSSVHAVLGDLFLHRVKDAQEGRPPKAGLPGELQNRLDALPELARYSVDRLREHSQILEPRDHVRAFQGRELKEVLGHDRLGERLYLLVNRTEPEQLAEESETLLGLCSTTPTTETLPRIVLALLEVAPRLDNEVQLRILNLLPTAIDWLESWLAAGRWPLAERLTRLSRYRARMIKAAFSTAASLEPSLVSSTIAQVIRQLRQLGTPLRDSLLSVAAQVFQALRRLGLRNEAESLVMFLDASRDRGDAKSLDSLIARLGLSIGWFTAGSEDAGWRILNEAGELLYLSRDPDIDERTRLAIAYAEALGFAPPVIAHGRLGEIFERLDHVRTTGSTNRWFTLKPLQLIDVVVRSVVTDEFALGPSIRSWLDDDEFLIRGRIHRDLSAVLHDQGIG